MEQLIQALQIFLKYGNPNNPTHCEHDELTICGISPDEVSVEDKTKLDELGFFVSESDNCFRSFRFGRAYMKMKCPKKINGECKYSGSDCNHAVQHKPNRWCKIPDKPCPTCVPVEIKHKEKRHI